MAEMRRMHPAQGGISPNCKSGQTTTSCERPLITVKWGFYRLLVVGLGLLHGHAYSQSFDCKRAATGVEHAICYDKDLGDLDLSLARELKKALVAAPGERKALLSEERRWIAYRDKHCATEGFRPGESFEQCLSKLYTARITELKSRNDAAEPALLGRVIAASDPELCSK